MRRDAGARVSDGRRLAASVITVRNRRSSTSSGRCFWRAAAIVSENKSERTTFYDDEFLKSGGVHGAVLNDGIPISPETPKTYNMGGGSSVSRGHGEGRRRVSRERRRDA